MRSRSTRVVSAPEVVRWTRSGYCLQQRYWDMAFRKTSFEEGLRRNPHVIAVDAGSSDPGPYYLGAGVSFTDRTAAEARPENHSASRKRPRNSGDHRLSRRSRRKASSWIGRPTLFERLRPKTRSFCVFAMIDSEVDKRVVEVALRRVRITSCGGSPRLTTRDVKEARHIVAQAGIEPIIRALRLGANVVLAGRAYDPSVFRCVPCHARFRCRAFVAFGKDFGMRGDRQHAWQRQ